jgi:hypothetical protein
MRFVEASELRHLKSAFGTCRFHVLFVDFKGNAPTSLVQCLKVQRTTMSTIASPRPSIALSSRRTSTSTDRSVSATRNPGPATGNLRRNRAALRDYYNLKAGSADQSKDVPPTPTLDPEIESELDKEGFDPEQYVKDILAREGLEGVMRVEAGLVSEIRTLDGEKKALVYDNYSKLIAATDTIRKMRTNMDPLTPTTATLTPAIGHIAETATALSESLRKQHGDGGVSEARKKQEQQELVRWVLDAPGRLSKLMGNGQEEEARAEWSRVSSLLDKWQSVPGARDVRKACERALEDSEA